ncbi:MAG: amidohydrolase [Burkholderiales bacterium]|nr:amidohydrolase [Burkholderiales bacterium]
MRKIDVHHHYLARHYLDAVGIDRVTTNASARSVPNWSPQWSLDIMGRFGIETAILSVSAPGIGLDTPQQTALLARECNEGQARLASDYPGRFGFFAATPLPDIDASLDEIGYALDVLDADGVGLLSNYRGTYIGDPTFWPLFEELERRKAVLFVHPTAPAGFRGLESISSSTLEFPFDTTRAAVSLLYHGTAARYPSVRIILSHAGGAIPYLAGRTAALSERNPDFVLRGSEDMLPSLRRFYYDITQSASGPTFAALRTLAPVTKIVFGSDCPFAGDRQLDLAAEDFSRLDLPPDQRAAIAHGNAAFLFPRFNRSAG